MWASLQGQSFFSVLHLRSTSWEFQEQTGKDEAECWVPSFVLSNNLCDLLLNSYFHLISLFGLRSSQKFTAFCANSPCLSTFQVQSGTSPQDWCPLYRPPWAFNLLLSSSFSLTRPHLCLSSDFSLSIPFIIFDIRDSHGNWNSFKNVPFMVSKKAKLIPKWLI